MDSSTFSNKTEIEDVTGGDISELYYLLKKQYGNLSNNFELIKQELQETRRNYNAAIDAESQVIADFETFQLEEEKRKNEFQSKVKALQEDILALNQECTDIDEQNKAEIKKLQAENERLVQAAEQPSDIEELPSIQNTEELDDIRNKLSLLTCDSVSAQAALEQAKEEIASWRFKIEEIMSEIGDLRAAADARREEMRDATEREAIALAELATARAMLNQVNRTSLEPHAEKGNSVFAEVEDKRQEMAKNLQHMKQTNSRLRRDLANVQAELEALLVEKQTIWSQHAGTGSQYDRELIEDYEVRIAQLETLCQQQWKEINRGLCKLSENANWLPGVIEHLKSEREKLRAEVLAKGAAQVASAAQVRELRRKVTLETINAQKHSPICDNDTSVTIQKVPIKIDVQKVDDVKKKVSFN